MIDILIIVFMSSIGLMPVVGYWRLFEKAQQRGWKVLIPLYNFVIFLRIIRRPAWWNLLYYISFFIMTYWATPIFFFILIFSDFWRCYTLFGMNIDFYSKVKNFTFLNILIVAISSPYILGRRIVSGYFGFPDISFNKKAIYSAEYLGQLSKESSAKELHEMRREEKTQDLLQDHQMARPLGIPLFSYDLKDIKKAKNLSWPHLLGAISWLGIFIYYWIVDWGKPGFTDADLSKTHNPAGREVLDFIQPEKNTTEYIQFSDEISPILDFIADLVLYTIGAFIGSIIILYLSNFIFRILNNIYWKILNLIKSYIDKK